MTPFLEVKDVRNALIHNSGTPRRDFFEKYPSVPKDGERIAITWDYYRRAALILDAVAHSANHGCEVGPLSTQRLARPLAAAHQAAARAARRLRLPV